MTTILIAISAMLVLGLIFGIGLALASRAFAVDEDERVEEIVEELPGANCGACGYGGCRAYAEAVVEGEDVDLCTAGGPEVADAVADIMGVETESRGEMRAVVHCQGGTDKCGLRADYDGEPDCRAADVTSGGPKACTYGCLGFGSCAEACPFDAITMSNQRLPVIDPDKCTACGICVGVCPRDLISLLDREYTMYLGCSSRNSAKAVKDVCSVGCITCGMCERKDPNEAIVIENGLPVLDYEKAEGDFSVAAEVCPMDSYVVEEKERVPAGSAQGSGEQTD
jgi:Na+-translocating ferredoxin:NAD+ oxidoreductase RNF subunit RnfB